MNKTKKQIENMLNIIETELKNLPPYNVFGESNADSIAESREWVAALEDAMNGKVPTGCDAVDDWVSGRWSELSDYEEAQ